MKQFSLFCLRAAVVFGAATVARAEDSPNGNQLARYDAMLSRSPFAVATPVARAAAAPESIKDLFIESMACSDDECVVTLASTRDKNFTKIITTRKAVDGFNIPNIKLTP